MNGYWKNSRKEVTSMANKPQTIAEILARLADEELISLLPWIRDENGEKISLIELKHYLKEATRQ